MELKQSVFPAEAWPGPLLAIGLFEGTEELDGPISLLDQKMEGAIADVMANGDFKGKSDQTLLLYSRGALPAPRLLLVGLGEPDRYRLDVARQAGGTAAKFARSLRVPHYGLLLPEGLEAEAMAQAAAEGTVLGLYRYLAYRTTEEDPDPDPERFDLLCAKEDAAAVAAGLQRGEIVSRAVCLTRDLVNQPPSDLTPTRLAEVAEAVAEKTGLSYQVLGPDEIAEVGMGALMGVARGSNEEARFIILEHNADRQDLPAIVLVGKGITFDAGGLDIKTHEGMLHMKKDMGGAGVVLGAMQAVAELDLPQRIIGLMPATENLLGGSAYKPGDVLRSLSGKTIEIINTDAEGRLILADALAYASRYEPAFVIDLATLTGSCVVALGNLAAGLMGNDQALQDKIEEAAESTDERVWSLPMWPEYKEELKSDIADIKNTGGRMAGASKAALFLQEFIPDCSWAHLDIAGPTAISKDQPYVPKGATGYGVRLLAHMLRTWEG